MKTPVLFTALLLVACGDGADLDASEQAVGTVCPDGTVLWTFGASAPGLYSSEYDSQAPDASVPPLPRSVITEVQELVCRFPSSATNASIRATASCRDMTRCTLQTNCVDDYTRFANPTFALSQQPTELRWHCSDQDAGLDYVATGGKDSVTFYCPQPPVPPRATPARTACVPKQCHGATRRDADMNCVADFTRVPVTEQSARVLWLNLEPKYQPRRTRVVNGVTFDAETSQPSDYRYAKVLNQDQRYHVTGGILYGSGVPKEARAALWLTEKLQTDTGRSIDVFRCVARVFDVGQTAPQDRIGSISYPSFESDIVLSPDCFNEAVTQNQRTIAARKIGMTLDTFNRTYKPRQLDFHLSFDMEAKNVFVPKGQDPAVACAPNPLAFFYDGTTKTYDYKTYFEQQELHTFQRGSAADSNFTGWGVSTPNRIEMGINDVRNRLPAVTIRTNSVATQRLSIEADWYIANDPNGYYEVYMARHFKPKLTAFLVPRGTDGGYQAPGPLGFEQFGQLNLPTGESTGSEPSVSVDALGVTVNGGFIVDAPLKAKLLDDRGPIGVGATGSRTYEVLACVEGRAGDYSINSRFWTTGINYDLTPVITVGNASDTEAAFKPPGFPSPGQGCRWSRTPLIITIDKSVGAVEPIAEVAWEGQVTGSQNGNGGMSQQNDNDNDRSCTTNSSGRQKCDTASRGSQRGSGNFGRTYYATSTSSVADPGAGNPAMSSADDSSASGNAEVLGFQVLDPSNASTAENWSLDTAGQKNTVTMTITPPWDNIWQALRRAANGNTNPEWNKGRYAGLLGLGVGWGFKIPLNQFGIVTITISVGFSLALTASVTYSRRPDDAYKCLGRTTPCVEVNSTSLSFAEANQACSLNGARLAELSSQTESAVLSTLLNTQSLDNFWVGAQLNNEFTPASCLFSWNGGQCTPAHKTTYR